ncbi:MAG TPA: hypothetical protein VHR72_14105 [Gemmataceae bacterium]|nr:hypothetical protein [Gemmataceae bacterium]
MIAAVTFTLDPAWPRMPLGLGVLSLAAVLLVALTVWTYVGARGTSWRRLGIVLALRLIALAVTVLLVLRPSFATEEEDEVEASRMLLVVDRTLSMKTPDEGDVSRLEAVQKLLASSAVRAEFARLGRKKIEIVQLQAADKLEPYDPAGKPQGHGTDIAGWLDSLVRDYANGPKVQAAFLLSDGGDTGDPAKTLAKAAEFRGRFPIHTFGVGTPAAIGADKDIALDEIFVEPRTLLAKTKFRVKVLARAPGFNGATTDVSLWIEDRATKSMKELKRLPGHRYTGAAKQEIAFEADAPDTEGEVKLVVKSDYVNGEAHKENNEIATFADVSKEGVRVLWVEGQRRWEFVLPIRESLRKDRRFQVFEDFRPRRADRREPAGVGMFDKTYDVVVIGDLSAARFGDTATLRKMAELVETQGMGVLMLGGNETFGAADWQTSALGTNFFPVDLRAKGQIDRKVRVTPTKDGLNYVLRLADDPVENDELWKRLLDPLNGISDPGAPDPRATVLAVSDFDANLPLLATIDRGKGRVMTFAGDTTSIAWRRTEKTQLAYDRFWKRMILWLAHQENARGNLVLDFDQRRVDKGRGQTLSFRTGFRGVEAKGATYVGKVIGPNKEEYPLPLPGDPAKTGHFAPPAVGEYMIEVVGKGTLPSGQAIEEKARARFLVIEEDRETQRIAADFDLLEKLAIAAGGKFAHADERNLVEGLAKLEGTRVPATVRIVKWPDWRRDPSSESSIAEQFDVLWRSTALGCLAVYMTCLCLEWYLRRRWGMA